ncbi:DUF1758 domain-containing protein [Trichonephila clavata]|uniref:DUF1758 domain-containing protein n=1 Tax=Trichonephila clavata TaxID=2740835 RepID=A0A8X6HCZ3_TRICU|nr:DUF1758 domain-containing protein [Trichonephila clavata]
MSETEKAQMAQNRIARGHIKASLTRLESSFDELNTKNEASILLSRLDNLFNEFERLDSTLSLEESELEEFEERYFNLNPKFKDKLDKLNLFVSTVHSQVSISNIEEFQYLKGLLTNEPASLIKHIPISNDSYEEAWQKLLDSGKIVGSKNEPIAQRTMFECVVAGKLNIKNKEPNELYSPFLSTENELKTDSLLQRTKWKYPNNNFKVGEVVIIKKDNIPPATWPLGKIIETHPGKDGVVRVVTPKTVKGLFKRLIFQLCKLPLHQE